MVYMSGTVYPKHSCVSCFSMLADRTRLKIIQALKKNSVNVSELTHSMRVTQPTVSHHLKILSESGFAVSEKKGRETYYRFNENYPCKGCGVFGVPIKIV